MRSGLARDRIGSYHTAPRHTLSFSRLAAENRRLTPRRHIVNSMDGHIWAKKKTWFGLENYFSSDEAPSDREGKVRKVERS